MKKFIVGIIMGSILTGVVYASILQQPPKIDDVALRQYLKLIADNFNRFEITTTSPNGNIRAEKGQGIVYNNGGTLELWVNSNGATTWQQI